MTEPTATEKSGKKPLNPVLVAGLAALVALVAAVPGYFAGRSHSAEGKGIPANATATAPASTRSGAAVSPENGADAETSPGSSKLAGMPAGKWSVEDVRTIAGDLTYFDYFSSPENFLALREHVNPGDIPQMIEELSQTSGMLHQHMLIPLLQEILTEADPLGSWQTALQTEDPGMRQGLLHRTLMIIGRDDPQKAWEMLEAMEDQAMAGEMTSWLLYSMSETQPDLAFEKSLELYENGKLDKHRLQNVLRQIADRDVGKAMLLAERFDDGALRNDAIATIAGKLAEENVDKALQWLDRWGDEIPRQQAIQKIIGSLAYSDPAKAAEIAHLLREDGQSSYTYSNIASNWAERDPVAARSWAESLPPETRSLAMTGIAQHLAKKDPKAGLDLLMELDGSQQQQWAINNALGDWAEKDQEAALAYLETIQDKVDTKSIYPSVISHIARKDPADAADLLLQLEDKNAIDNSLYQVMREWAQTDPRQALDWARKLTDDKQRDRALGELFSRHGEQDPESAAALVDSLSPGPERDAAVQGLTSALSEIDPPGAIAWSQTLSDEKNRQSHVKNIARNWLRAYPDEARQWISSSNLPEDTKKDLLDRD